MIFMFDAGMNSLPAFFEYRVSPVRGFTMRTPHCAFLNTACDVSESISCRSSARGDDLCAVCITVTHPLNASGNVSESARELVRAPNRWDATNARSDLCTVSLVSGVGGAQRVVLAHRYAQHSRGFRELLLDPLKNETREILSGRNELSVAKFGHIDVDVPVVEPIPHLRSQNVVENSKIDDESRDIVDRSSDRDVADVAMPVIVRPGAGSERLHVLFIAPFGATVSVRR